jgi:hypothetical protein
MTGHVSLCTVYNAPPEDACDVTAFRSVDGTYVLAVRSERPVDEVPGRRIDILRKQDKTDDDWATFWANERRRGEILAATAWTRIDHAKAGTVETYGNIQDLRAALVTLKSERVCVPDRIFAFIDDQLDLFGFGSVH